MRDKFDNSGEEPADDRDHIEFLQRIVKYQDGALSEAEVLALEAELLTSDEKMKIFAEVQIRSADIHNLLRQDAYVVIDDSSNTQAKSSRSNNNWNLKTVRNAFATVLAIAAILFFTIKLPVLSPKDNSITTKDSSGVSKVAEDNFSVTLVGAWKAIFFGGLVPEVRSVLAPQRDYVLTSGLVELSFPTGASVIVESPAVFRVLGRETLAMETGRCSVHAPDGAEGFRVETPMSRIVDRGTRFTVSVSENCETEVQVIEGVAEVYRKSDQIVNHDLWTATSTNLSKDENALPLQERLVDKDARRFTSLDSASVIPIEYSATDYRRQLPDRVVRYDASRSNLGGVERLKSITVQRDGRVFDHLADSLIPVRMTWFKSSSVADTNGHLMGGLSLPIQRSDWLGDMFLNTGVINPGGHSVPLVTAPVMNSIEDPQNLNTPGFAVKFATPVMNCVGPDVVFFELQTMTNNPNGDPFHVSPMSFENNRRTYTVHNYDLTLASSESLPLDPFYLYRSSGPVGSLQELEATKLDRTPMRKSFRILAVGIDLSDLGFKLGEVVDELFIQDADENEQRVDPVLVVGLPNVELGGDLKGE